MALFIEISVMPSSGRQEIKKTPVGFKCFLKSPPEKGKANDELIRFLSEKLDVSRDSITITSGLAGRKKRVRIEKDWTIDEFMHKLGVQ